MLKTIIKPLSNLDNGFCFAIRLFGDDFYAIGCRKADKDVAAKLTEAIGTLIDSGEAAEISEKWFGKDIVILKGYDK